MKSEMDTINEKYPNPSAERSTGKPTVPVVDDVPVEYLDYPIVVEFWRHLKRFGHACGIRLAFEGDDAALVFSPPLKPPTASCGDYNRWLVGVEAVRLLRAAEKDLRILWNERKNKTF